MEKFRGILFTLKKRVPSIRENDSDFYKYLIFGHYDGFDVHFIDKWYDFRPKGLMDRNLQVDLNLPYIDQYTVRALIPENRDDLERRGFAYSFWEEVEGKSGTSENADGKKQYPYISMSMINLSENYVKSRKRLADLQKGIEEIIIEGADNIECPLAELHCGLFPSIGYSDFVILFQTDDLKKASDVISFIRGSSETGVGAVISNCYSVCGVEKKFLDQTLPVNMENIQISIRINLKGGISANDFLEILKREIDRQLAEISESPELTGLRSELTRCFFVTFGNADCIILPDQPLERYLRLHAKGGIFHPSNAFFQNHITDIRTSVRIQGAEDVWDGRSENLPTRNMESRRKAFQEFIDRYDIFVERNYLHIRSARAMRQVMKSYLNIAQASHGFDVERVIGRAFSFLINAMDSYISEKDSGETDKNTESIEAVEALDIFKDHVGTFIADLGRSDRPFIEGNTLAHPSIGSATKLIFAYSHILKEVLERYDDKNRFHFVVKSGGCDCTNTIDLFSFAYPRENINKPILLRIPEMSLYDIQGTLFRMLHECMHFLGDRHRRERCSHVIKALAKELAWDICDSKFNEEWLEENRKRAFWGLTDEDKKLLDTAMADKFCELRLKSKDIISRLFQRPGTFGRYMNGTDEYGFYSNEFKHRLQEIPSIICGSHKGGLEKERSIQECIYDIFIELDKEWYIFIIEKLTWLYKEHKRKKEESEATGVRFSLEVFSMRAQEFMILERFPEEKVESTAQFIQAYMETFAGIDFMIDGDRLTPLRYDRIIEVVMTAMTEGFSDCTAIRILNMPLEDFILSFLYELWDIERAFPLGSDNILRMGADLSVMYGIRGSLGPELRERIREKAAKRKAQGYEYKNTEIMLERLDMILSEYQTEKYHALREETEEYLKCCIAGRDWYFDRLGELYRKCGFDSSEEIYEVVDELICQWMSLSQ